MNIAKVLRLFVICSFSLISADVLAIAPSFEPGKPVGVVTNNRINEASGLVASRQQDGVFWVHNDSGDGPTAYAINTSGDFLGDYTLSGVFARDWEDMATGPGSVPGESYLYLGDIGDNSAVRSSIQVHRVLEPSVSSQQSPVSETLADFETITLQYPDGPRDAETLLIDPDSGDLYIISKRDSTPRIYRAPFPQSVSSTNTLEYLGLLDWGLGSLSGDQPTAGDLSADGKQILIRGYSLAYYWSVPPNQSLHEVLTTPGHFQPLISEPQGEAIAFSSDGKDFFTLSEGFSQPLIHYERIPEPSSLLLGISTLLAFVAQGLRLRKFRNLATGVVSTTARS